MFIAVYQTAGIAFLKTMSFFQVNRS